MNKSMKISGLVWAMLLASGVAQSAGLGKLTVQSALGQPLRAEIELLAVTKDELGDISAKLASHDAFKQARVDRTEALSNLRFSVEQRPNGQPVIRISSTTGVADPFLDLLIELNWSTGRLIREYTLLLDPVTEPRPAEPVKPAVVTDNGRAPETRPLPAPTPVAEPTKPRTLPQPMPVHEAPKRYGPVKTGESLRAIAGKVRPAEVSLDQMMVGLYQTNKSAFMDDNMNLLKRGQVLNVPDLNTAMATPPRDAARIVKGHATEWHAYRKKLAGMAEEVPQVEAKPSTGTITPKGEDKPAPAPTAPKDVLKLSKGDPGSAAGKADPRIQERLHSLEEEIAAKSRALTEAQDRVAQLERTVRDMQKLLELKTQEAAKPAEPAQAQPPEAPAPAPEPAEPPVAQPPAAQPAPVPAPLPVAEPESSWISTFIGNPLYIGGVVAALLLSGLLWMMMVGNRRRKGLTKFEDSIMTGGEFKNNAVFNVPPTGGAAGVAKTAPTEGSMLLTDFSRMGMGGIDSHEVDPIAEAEVYMAYGRDAQAEEILKEALGKDPSRHEIALKLLEIYAARKDAQQFETTASELYASLGGQNTPVWQRAAEMGRSIDPDNPLYRVAPTVSAATATAAVTGAAAASAVLAKSTPVPELAPEPMLETIANLEVDAGLEAPFQAPSVQDNALEFTPSLDTGWGDEALTATLPEAPLEPIPQSPEPLADRKMPSEFAAFDLDMEAPPQGAEPAPEDAESLFEALPEALAYEVAPELETLEIPAPPLDLEAVAEAAEAPAVPELDFSGIDLDLAVEPIPEVPEIEIPEVQELEAPMVETSALDFEMPADLEVATPETAAESGIDPALREEVNTKLDLAKAYLEMGDREGAREILQEVLAEGDAGQKAEAGKLMAEAG